MIQNFGGGEILVIIILALVVLGPDRLPEMARSAGRMLHKVRTMTAGLQDQVKEVMDDPAMQPLRELGEIAARPRQKLSEYALEAEAEERSRTEQNSLDASAQAAEIIAAAEAAELAEAASNGNHADPEPAPAVDGDPPPADATTDAATEAATDAATDTPSDPPADTPSDTIGAADASPVPEAADPTEVDPVEPASHETA